MVHDQVYINGGQRGLQVCLRPQDAVSVLDAVAAVGPRPEAIIRWLDTMPNRAGALRTYRFDRFGDTTLRTYGVYRIRRGRLVYAGASEAP